MTTTSSSFSCDFPCWIHVAPYLNWSDILSLRLVCQGWQRGIHEQLPASLLAHYMLAPLLQRHGLYLVAGEDSLDTHWHCNATQQQEEDEMELETSGTQSFLTRALQPHSRKKQDPEQEQTPLKPLVRTSAYQPLDLLLQIVRVAHFMPMEAAVGFSGKYGRQVIPLRPENTESSRPHTGEKGTSVNDNASSPSPLSSPGLFPHYYFERCQRQRSKAPPPSLSGDTKSEDQFHSSTSTAAPRGRRVGGPCPTCKYPLPVQPTSRSRPSTRTDPPQIAEYFEIQFSSSSSSSSWRCLDLRDCHPKCFPNLPHDSLLQCPVCHEANDTEQTLVVSDFCYKSELGTEKPQCHQMALTLTPTIPSLTQQETTDIKNDEQEETQAADLEEEDVFLSIPRRPTKRARRDRQFRRQREASQFNQQQRPQQQGERRAASATTASRTTGSFSSSSSSSFPPRYRDMMIPSLPQAHATNAKYGLTIYCAKCRKFALLAPAGICEPSHHHQEVGGTRSHYLTIAPPRPRVEPPFVVGGFLQRHTCRHCCPPPGGEVDPLPFALHHQYQYPTALSSPEASSSSSCNNTIPCPYCRYFKKRALGYFDQERACVTCQPFSPH